MGWMTVEAVVFLGIVLLVWFMAFVGSWLREQIERYTRDQDGSSVHETPLSSPACARVQPTEATADLPDAVPARVLARVRPNRPAPFRYRSRTAARRGLILVTVFGACKALETRDEC